jgi:hypothetical protein
MAREMPDSDTVAVKPKPRPSELTCQVNTIRSSAGHSSFIPSHALEEYPVVLHRIIGQTRALESKASCFYIAAIGQVLGPASLQNKKISQRRPVAPQPDSKTNDLIRRCQALDHHAR